MVKGKGKADLEEGENKTTGNGHEAVGAAGKCRNDKIAVPGRPEDAIFKMESASCIRGRIVKGIAGFYYVDTKEYGVLECHARGIFRKEQLRPLVGDFVRVEIIDAEKREGSIASFEPRKNRLIRPDVANVDQALVIFAYSKPEPNLNLLDKFLIMMEKNEVSVILCFNKEDLASEVERQRIRDIYAASGVQFFSMQADAGKISRELRELLEGKFTVLAGPSGVGKSTFVNRIFPEAQMETGNISRKLERGRHTTRHSELFEISRGTFLCDTPGFTAFDIDQDIEKEELRAYYPEFYPYEGSCRYQGCTHTHEPGCAVKAALEEGRIPGIRYEGYVTIFEELKNRKRY